MAALKARFGDHTDAIFKRHNINHYFMDPASFSALN
jgi:hypothetical protein